MSDSAATVAVRPLWVRVGLLGITSRKSAVAFIWLSVVAAIASGLYGFRDPRFFFGAGLVFAALWYWLAIKWVDRNDRWP